MTHAPAAPVQPIRYYYPVYYPQPQAAPPAPSSPPPSVAPAAQAGVDLPPLPPGYTYVPVPARDPESLRKAQIAQELSRIDQRLNEIEQSTRSLGGPITLMALGYGGTLISGLIGLSLYQRAEEIQEGDYLNRYDELDYDDYDYNNDGEVDGKDTRKFRKHARIAGGVAAAGLTLGIVGMAKLLSRKADRRAVASERKQLKHEKARLLQELQYGFGAVPGQMQLQLQGRF